MHELLFISALVLVKLPPGGDGGGHCKTSVLAGGWFFWQEGSVPEAAVDHDDSPPERGVLDFAVIGGGASGFFAALRLKELLPDKGVAIFEKGTRFLQKVAISGGGRCNVTHACFDPAAMAANYPRGGRELRGAFHRWQPADTVAWFDRRGVKLKAEPDGRMFPITDSSDTVIQCFLQGAREARITLHTGRALRGLTRDAAGLFELDFGTDQPRVQARTVCVAAGSLKGNPLADVLRAIELSIVPLVPSLFAFNVNDPRITGLAGVSHPDVVVRRADGGAPRRGPILITHRGFSGPAILRLSAWEARELAAVNHHFSFLIDWLPEMAAADIQRWMIENRNLNGAMRVRNRRPAPLPKRLWESLLASCGIDVETTWAQLGKAGALALAEALKASRFEARGKTTNKDEFVTCGGLERLAVDFRTMRSRSVPGLYFAGEVIDIDGVTGGFNFQAAWTTAHIAATAAAEELARVKGEG